MSLESKVCVEMGSASGMNTVSIYIDMADEETTYSPGDLCAVTREARWWADFKTCRSDTAGNLTREVRVPRPCKMT